VYHLIYFDLAQGPLIGALLFFFFLSDICVLLGWVGFGLGHFGFQVKNVGSCPVHDMAGSGSSWVELVRNFVCNFRVESSFFKFRVKYFSPYPTRHLVGSGRIFRVGWVGWPVIRTSYLKKF